MRLRLHSSLLVAVGLSVTSGCAEQKRPAAVSVIAEPPDVLADGVAFARVFIEVVDDDNKPIEGIALSLTASGSENMLVEPGVTNAKGRAEGRIASTRAEEKALTATTATDVPVSGTETVRFFRRPDPALSTLRIDKSEAAATGVDRVKVTATIVDSLRRPMPFLTVSFSTTRGFFVDVTASAARGTTGEDGMVTLELVSTDAGPAILSATIDRDGMAPLAIVEQPTVQFLAVLRAPSKSGTVAACDDGSCVVTANPDDGSISVFSTASNTRTAKVATGKEPAAVVIAPDNDTAFVANRADATVSKVTGIKGAAPVVAAMVEVGSEPVGLALSPLGRILYVTQLAESRLTALKTADMSVVAHASVPAPRAVAVTNDRDIDEADETVWIADFYGVPSGGEGQDASRTGKLRGLRSSDLSLVAEVDLAPYDSGIVPAGVATSATASPNQIYALAISGNFLYATSIAVAPTAPLGPEANLYPTLHVVDLTTRREVTGTTGTTNLARAVRAAGQTSIPADPVDVVVTGGATAWVVSRAADAVQRLALEPAITPSVQARTVSADPAQACHTPIGAVATGAGERLYVNCWSTRNLMVFDTATNTVAAIVPTSDPAPPSDSAHRGRRFFFTSRGRWSQDSWSSCASCHPDGLSDNITWSFPAGPRQSTSLDGSYSKGAGTAGKERVFNWTAIFDELADFESNTRNVSGGRGAITTAPCGDPATEQATPLPAGLGSPATDLQRRTENCTPRDWDDINDFVKTIRPPRGRASLDAAAVAAGRRVFEAGNCQACHGGAGWTVSRQFYTRSAANNALLAQDGLVAAQPAAADPGAPGPIGPAQLRCSVRKVGTFGVPGDDSLEKKVDGTRAQGAGGYNVPSLYGLSLGAPFLHHGQAGSLSALFADAKWAVHLRAANSAFQPTALEEANLTAFLLSIDERTPEIALPAGADTCPERFPFVSPSASTVTASPTVVVADGVRDAEIFVTARASDGRPLSGRSVTLAATGQGNVFTQPSLTDTEGVARGTLTSTIAGAKIVSATADGVLLDPRATVSFNGDATRISAALSTVTAEPSAGIVANGASPSTLTVRLRDLAGNPVEGVVVELASSIPNDVFVQPATTGSDGATTGTLTATRAGPHNIAATANPRQTSEVALANPAQVTFVAGSPSEVNTTVAVSPPGPLVANGNSTYTIEVFVFDEFFNAVSGREVIVTPAPGSVGSFTPPSGTTNVLGRFATLLKSTQSGTTFAGLDVSDAFTLTLPPQTFSAGEPDGTQSAISVGPPTNVPADEASEAPIVVQVRDTNQNAVAGRRVRISSTRGSADVISVSDGLTNGAGQLTSAIRSRNAGTAGILASIDTAMGPLELTGPSVMFTSTTPALRIGSFGADRPRVQPGGSVLFGWTLEGTPTTQLLTGATLGASDRNASVTPTLALDALDPMAAIRLSVFDAAHPKITFELVAAHHAAGGRTFANAIASFPDGSYATAGRFEGTTTFAPGVTRTAAGSGPSLFVAWYGADDILADVKVAGGGDYAEAFAAAAHPNGSLVVCGAFLGNFAAGTGEPGGATFSSTSFDAVVLTFAPDRTFRWAKRVVSDGVDQCIKAAVAPNGDPIVAGQFNGAATFGAGTRTQTTRTSAGGFDVFFARYAALDGSLLFAHQGGGADFDAPGAVVVDASGAATIVGSFGALGGAAGTTAVFNPGSSDERTLTQDGSGDVFIVRYRPDGVLTDAKRAGGALFESATAAATAPEGGLYLTGPLAGSATFAPGELGAVTLTPVGNRDHFVVRLGSGLTPIFAKRIEASGAALELRGAAATADGSLVVTGFLNGTATFGPGEAGEITLDSGLTKVVVIALFRADGTFESARQEGGPGETKAHAVAAHEDGTLFIAGNFSGSSVFGAGEPEESLFTATAIEEGFALRLRPANSRITVVRPEGLAFAKSAGATGLDRALGLGVYPDGASVIAGTFQTGPITFGTGEANPITLTPRGTITEDYLARFRRDGSVSCACRVREGGFGQVRSVAAFADGDAVVTGDFFTDASITPDDTIVDPNGPSPIRLTSAGSTDIFVARFKADCQVVFAKRAGAGGNDQAFVVAALEGGAAAVGGAYTSAATFGEGELPAGGDEGQTTLPNMASGSGFVAIYNKSGTLRFVRRIGGSGFTEQNAEGLAAFPDGGFVAVGSFSGSGFFDPGPSIAATGHDVFVARYSKDGAPVWVALAAGSPKAFGKRVAILPDGDVVVVGEFLGSVRFDPAGQNVTFTNPSQTATDVFVARYRGADGGFVWARHFGGGFEDVVRGIATFPDGKIIVAGGFNGSATFGRLGDPRRTVLSTGGNFDEDIFVAVLGGDGDIVTVKQTGVGPDDERVNGVAALPDGSALLAGEFGSATLTFGAGERNARTLTKVGGFRDTFLVRVFPYVP